MKPQITLDLSAITQSFSEVVESGHYSNFGSQVTRLERVVGEFIGVHPARVVLLSSATSAISGAASVLSASRWVVPSWTFAATPLALLAAGQEFSFVDIADGSHWIGWHEFLDEPVGLVAVAPFGSPVPDELIRRTGPTILDCAASLPAFENSSPDVSPGVVLVFSLHATKVLGIGEGGVAVCGSEETARSLRAWSNFGFDGSREASIRGVNAKMSEFQALVGLEVFKNWEFEKEEWCNAREIAREFSVNLPAKLLDPGKNSQFVSPYWILDFNSETERVAAEASLREAQIDSRRWWGNGTHDMPALRQIPRGQLVNTERRSRCSLGLPFFRGISRSSGRRIVDSLADGLDRLT